MLKFNDRNIFSGYIKQLLHSFNLPTSKIIKKDTEPYEGGLYINANKDIVEYNYALLGKDDKGEPVYSDTLTYNYVRPYIYNKLIPNYTKTLKLNNVIYDTYTHEYLGNYLRFIRDYHNMNLMSMYNCFSNKTLDDANLKIDFEAGSEVIDKVPVSIQELDLNKEYTLNLSNFKNSISNFTINIDVLEIKGSHYIHVGENVGVINGQIKQNYKWSKDITLNLENNILSLKTITDTELLQEGSFVLKNQVNGSYNGKLVFKFKDIQAIQSLPEDFYSLLTYTDVLDAKPTSVTVSNNYKIYSIPVKFNQKYTIAIDCVSPVEMFCGFYGKGYYSKKNIETLTYKKYSCLTFNKPIVYDKLSNISEQDYLREEQNLRLFIKLPFNNDSSITVLEGVYLNTNDTYFASYKQINENTEEVSWITNPFKIKQNYSVINFDNENYADTPLISSLQLLKMNTHVSYPIADRLIEYLAGNVITNLDPISDNVKRLQTILRNRHKKIRTVIKKEDVEEEIYYYGINSIKYYGVWEPRYKALLYEIAKEMNIINKNDLLGYLDKDIERVLGADPDIYKEE